MSKIEWTGRTWNYIVGCSVVSPGCTHCYAMRQAARIERMSPDLAHYRGLTQPSKAGPVWTGKVACAGDEKLLEPLRRRKPTTWFVNSMSDLFHEAVPDEWIDRVFAVMALSPQHTFQVLTKRAKRMREYLSPARAHPVALEAMALTLDAMARDPKSDIGADVIIQGDFVHLQKWPLPNVWLGVSAEDQTRADERVPDLLATPAAVRFVSAEPLLGPINFRRLRIAPNHHTIIDALDGYAIASTPTQPGRTERTAIDWIIVGGESGRDARPMHPDWVRAIRDQCAAASVPFFFKQHGEWIALTDQNGPGTWPVDAGGAITMWPDGRRAEGGTYMQRVGKSFAGRTLDGCTHDDMPRRA